MFKELIHIFRTYFITFRYLTKSEIFFIKNIIYTAVIIYILLLH